jgi:drug/metabolite transporter (DMT)-like permease
VLGVLLSLLSSATFAFNNACTRRGVLTGTVWQALSITVPIGVPMFLVAALVAGTLGMVASFPPLAILWLSIAGVIHFVWGRYCNYRSTRALGANLAGPVQQADLLLSLGLAVLILGETLTPLRIIGIVLMILGPALTLGADQPRARASQPESGHAQLPIEQAAPKFVPNYTEGYIFAVLSGTGYGVSPIFVRMAVENAGPGLSLVGGLISYCAATVVIALILAWPGQLRHALAVNAESAKWFTFSGVLVCLSQIFRYMALSVAPVSVVQPIQRTSLIFRLFFSWMLNREYEVFGGRVIMGTILALIGALALSVSTDVVISLVPLPDWVVTLARWQWP